MDALDRRTTKSTDYVLLRSEQVSPVKVVLEELVN